MAASVRIDDEAFSDPRIKRLGRLLGTSVYDALGRMAFVWRYCTERQVYSVSRWTLADLTDTDEFAEHLITSELGTVDGDMVRIRGLKGRIEWLAIKREAAVNGGKARATGARRDQSGRLVSTDHPAKSQPPAGEPSSQKPAPGWSVAGDAGPARQPEPSAPTPVTTPAPTPTKEKNKSAATQHPDFRQFTDAFQSLYQDANAGSKPTWEPKQRQAADRLLKVHGLEECVRRAEIMFRSPPNWPPGPYDLMSLAQHFDKFATPGQAQLPGLRGRPGDRGLQVEDFLAFAAHEDERQGE